MAKINILSEKIISFGEIFHVREQIHWKNTEGTEVMKDFEEFRRKLGTVPIIISK